MTAQARDALAQIRTQAEEIIRQAQLEADAIRNSARETGLEEARRQAQQSASQQTEQKVATILPTIERAAQQLNAQRDAWLAQWEQQAVVLAVKMAEKIVRKELRTDPGIPLVWIREALELIGQHELVTIEVSAADHQTLGPKVEQLQQSLHRVGTTRVVVGPQLTAGDCRIVTQYSEFDYRIQTMIERLENEMT